MSTFALKVTFDKPAIDRHGEHIKVHVNGEYSGRVSLKKNVAVFRGPGMVFGVRVKRHTFDVHFDSIEDVMKDEDAVRTLTAAAVRNVPATQFVA